MTIPIQNRSALYALDRTSAAVLIVRPDFSAAGKLTDFVIVFANPAFYALAGVKDAQCIDKKLRQDLGFLAPREMWNLLLHSWKSKAAQSADIRITKQEQSLVLQVCAAPAEDQMVITINDITKLSHSHEMLEQQTTLMDENARALDALRASLEAEIARRGQLEDKLRRMAETDPLSGLANRRAFMEKSAAEFRRSRRYDHPLSVVMLDLDKFKRVNDTYGHAAGDTVIVAVSQVCQSLSRNGIDLTGRLGGEEFAILLPETTLEGARNFAERLRLTIETTPIFADVTKIMITASMGIATLGKDDNDINTIINRADAALYASKNAGRNMVSAG